MIADSSVPTLFVVSGPSGAGKKTLLDFLADRFPQLKRIATFTTRDPREGEVDGVDYRFVSPDEFRQLVESGAVFEYTRTYGDYFYGSPRSLIEATEPHNGIVELDVRGMLRVRASTQRRLISVFIAGATTRDLAARIHQRRTEQNMPSRLSVAENQLDFAWTYDYILFNEEREQFLSNAEAVVKAELLRTQGVSTLLQMRHSIDPTLFKGKLHE